MISTFIIQCQESTIILNLPQAIQDFKAQWEGRIQDFLIGGSYLQRGFNLLNFSDNLLIFPDFSANELIRSRRRERILSGSATEWTALCLTWLKKHEDLFTQ